LLARAIVETIFASLSSLTHRSVELTCIFAPVGAGSYVDIRIPAVAKTLANLHAVGDLLELLDGAFVTTTGSDRCYAKNQANASKQVSQHKVSFHKGN
jgi:hypothetical protein